MLFGCVFCCVPRTEHRSKDPLRAQPSGSVGGLARWLVWSGVRMSPARSARFLEKRSENGQQPGVTHEKGIWKHCFSRKNVDLSAECWQNDSSCVWTHSFSSFVLTEKQDGQSCFLVFYLTEKQHGRRFSTLQSPLGALRLTGPVLAWFPLCVFFLFVTSQTPSETSRKEHRRHPRCLVFGWSCLAQPGAGGSCCRFFSRKPSFLGAIVIGRSPS